MIRFSGFIRAVCAEVSSSSIQCLRFATAVPGTSISIPNAIKRTPTELLEALAETVGEDKTAPHFSLIDDPALIPSSAQARKVNHLAREMGKRAARVLAAEWPTLFQYDEDEPRLDVFRPLADLDPSAAEPTEENLGRLLKERKVEDAIKFYERLSSEGINVSTDMMEQLFFLICYYNARNAPFSELEEWHGARNFFAEEAKPDGFEEGGIADVLFETLEKTENVYSAMIAGLCKFQSVEAVKRAESLYNEMKEKKLKPHLQTFCGLMKNASSFEEARLLVQDMRDLGIRPNIDVFNSLLVAVNKDGLVDRDLAVKRILREARQCSCSFTLTTFSQVLQIAVNGSQENERLPITRVVQILDELEKMESIEAVSVGEQDFYVEAMNVARNAENLEVADRLVAFYRSPKNNAKLPALTGEPSFYLGYLTLSIPVLPIEELEKRYKGLVPRIVGVSRALILDMLERLRVDFRWSLLRRVIEDGIAGRFLTDNKICHWMRHALITTDFKALSADERDECRNLAVRIVDILNEFTKFQNVAAQIKWNPISLSECALLLLTVGERERGWELLKLILDEKAAEGEAAPVAMLGYPHGEIMRKLFDQALQFKDWENACNCLQIADKFSAEMRLRIEPYADRILQTCNLNHIQKSIVNNFVKLRQ